MKTFFLIALILLSTWVLICYAFIKFVAGIIAKKTAASWVANKKVVVAVSGLVALIPLFFFLFSTSAKNYKTAYLQPVSLGYKVTVNGKRVLMSHDPVSALLGNTYEASTSFLIPRQNGVINCKEIWVSHDNNLITGTITIDKKKMTVQLFYDKDQTSPCSWNGTYFLTVK